MRRLLACALLLTALPYVPSNAADPLLATWVVERTDPKATTLMVRGAAGARNGENAFAAVASATVDRDGRFTDADGGLFFGLTPQGDATLETPAGEVRCRSLPVVAHLCTDSFGGIGFAIWWDEVTFNRVLVVMSGRDKRIDLGVPASPGWRIRRWYGTTRVVTDADITAAGGIVGYGAGAFGAANAVGGPGGSVAIGHLPCKGVGYTGAGTGAAQLKGGSKTKTATCADSAPPAAAAKGSTEWVFDGAAAGVWDTPARLVVVERPVASRG